MKTPPVVSSLSTSIELAEKVYEQLRDLSHGSVNFSESSETIVQVIKAFVEKINDAHLLKIRVFHHGLENYFIPSSLQMELYRITKELIVNTLKHANAKELTIQLQLENNWLNIIVEDNGIGFNASPESFKKGIGLQSLSKRVEILKGTLDIDSTIGQGTIVIIDIPLIIPN